MMKIFAFAVSLLIISEAGAAPQENHWGPYGGADVSSNYGKAVELIRAGQYADAIPVLLTVASERPGYADAFNLLGYAYRKSGDLNRSGPAYKRALLLDPHHRGALEYQGELFLMLGQLSRAEANLARLRVICRQGCEEADALAAEIERWRAKNDN